MQTKARGLLTNAPISGINSTNGRASPELARHEFLIRSSEPGSTRRSFFRSVFINRRMNVATSIPDRRSRTRLNSRRAPFAAKSMERFADLRSDRAETPATAFATSPRSVKTSGRRIKKRPGSECVAFRAAKLITVLINVMSLQSKAPPLAAFVRPPLDRIACHSAARCLTLTRFYFAQKRADVITGSP